MKRLLCLFLLCSILVSFDKSAPKVLLFIKEGSPQLEYMLTHEVGKMTEILKKSGFEVKIATVSGKVLSEGSVTVKPDLKLSEVNIDDYTGFIFPCMVLDLASPEMITLVRTAAANGKPIAAQAGSVTLLAKAGILNGKKYATNIDTSTWPDFKNSIYSGRGVVQDGNIITSGVCPWIAKDTGYQDGTAELTQTLIDVINGEVPSTNNFNQKQEEQIKVDTVKAALIKAQNLFKEGKTEEASKIFASLMESHPDNRDAVQGWIIANMKRTPTGEEEMIGQLEGLEKLYPKNTAILFFKAYIQGEYKHYDESLATIEKLITMQPDSALNWSFKGGLLASMNKYEEAISSYTRAIQLDPNQAEYIYNQGCAYCLKGDKENALANLKRAISLSPRVREYAPKDEDFKSLWNDEDFKKLTESSTETINKGDVASAESVCSITSKNYIKQEFTPKISGTWKAVEAWIHEANLLGERNFYFTFLSNDSIKISEPERNWHSNGTWSIDLNENNIQWNMPDANESFKGKYDIVDGQLLLSGKGFVGAEEYICLRLKRQ